VEVSHGKVNSGGPGMTGDWEGMGEYGGYEAPGFLGQG
jgi:hypothetical protein